MILNDIFNLGLEIGRLPNLETLLSSILDLPKFRAATYEYGRVNAFRLLRYKPEITSTYSRVNCELTRRCRDGVNTFEVHTMYKRKADKVNPVDSDTKDG